MSEPWFFLNSLPRDLSQTVELDARETRHAGSARRLNKGDGVVLFDGTGLTADAELVEIGRSRARAKLLAQERHEPPRPALHLASALPKGDRQATMLAMATQLGMSSFTPLLCSRSVARQSPSASERWQRVCREACKQSRRPHLPHLLPPSTPDELMQRGRPEACTLLMHPSGSAAVQLIASATLHARDEIMLLIGPEGGFVENEIECARAAGAEVVSLGGGILRTETAALAALALFGL